MMNLQRVTGALLSALLMVWMFTPVSCAKQDEGGKVGTETDITVSEQKSDADGKSETSSGTAENKTEEEGYRHKVLRMQYPAPEMDLVDFDGKKITLEKFRGKTLVVVFWRPDFDICVQQMKELAAYKQKEDFVILAVSPEKLKDKDGKDMDMKKAAKQTLKKNPMDIVVAFDDESMKSISSYEVAGVPFYALIDPEGRIQMAGMFMVNQKITSGTFLDMISKVASGGNVSKCEMAQSETPEKYKNYIGATAKDFRVEDLSGEEQALSYYKGMSKVLLVFWSPYCAHCRRELPRLEVFSREYSKKRGLFIIGLPGFPPRDDEKLDEYTKMVKLLIDGLGVTFPNIPDYGGFISNDYKVEGVPSLFLIGEDGKILEAFSGESLFTAENLNCTLDRLDGESGKDG